MRKILFLIATIYTINYFVWLLPAYSVSKVHFEQKYSATEKEKIIIKDVSDQMLTPVMISTWSMLGMYGLFGASLFIDRKKKSKDA